MSWLAVAAGGKVTPDAGGEALEGWPAWPSPRDIQRGKPRQLFTEGAAVHAIAAAFEEAETPDDVDVIREGNARTIDRMQPVYRQLLDTSKGLRLAELEPQATMRQARGEA